MNKLDFNIDLDFDIKKHRSNVIKVIGVGGGGGNAVNYMYKKGIKDVDFVVVNTDAQDLAKSPIPIKVQIGRDLTEGLGAGAVPEIGKKAAEEDIDSIKKVLEDNTKMIFITAGMGGGTGTGAAPVIARLAREMGILSVGIVTSPFEFEGKKRLQYAEEGIEELRENVDSLIIINNNKLREVFGNLKYHEAFEKSDEILAKAASSIAEVITHNYKVNVDFRDVRTVLEKSGTAIMGSATASGEDRAKMVIENALDSPLLNDNKIKGAKNVLLLIVSGTDDVTLDEMSEINYYVQNEAGNTADIILGIGKDDRLKDEIGVTIIATGFPPDQQDIIANTKPDRKVHYITKEADFKSNQSLEQEYPHVIEEGGFQYEIDEHGHKQLLLDFEIGNKAEEHKQDQEEYFEEAVTSDYHDVQLENHPIEEENPLETDLKEMKMIDIQERESLEEEKPRGPKKVYKLSDLRKQKETEYEEKTQEQIFQEQRVQIKEEVTQTKKNIEESDPVEKFEDVEDITELPFEIAMKIRNKRKSNLIKYADKISPTYDDTPAYKKKGIEIDTSPKSTESSQRIHLDREGNFIIRESNSFLNDNVD
jgi:cell division protein FtsZ